MVTEALRILDRIPGVHAWETRAVIAELDVPDVCRRAARVRVK